MTPRQLLVPLALMIAPPAQAFDVERVSVGPDGGQIAADSRDGAVSADGRFVAFTTLAPLDTDDTNSLEDVYLLDRDSGSLTLVSRSIGGLATDRASTSPDISDSGDQVVFASAATNLVVGDSNQRTDVFLYNRRSGSLIRVSNAGDGSQANGSSTAPRISADGRIVAFASLATNLVDGDTNGHQDIFIHSVALGGNRRVNVLNDGREANGPSGAVSLSGDGLKVAFASLASNLNPVGGDQLQQIYVHDVLARRTSHVQLPADTIERSDVFSEPELSPEGEWIAFVRARDGGVGRSDIYLQELSSGDSILVTDPRGEPETGFHTVGGVSRGGEFVLFDSFSSNLIPGDLNGENDVLRFERATGESIRVSGPGPNAGGEGESTVLGLSPDGRYALFFSAASNLVAQDTNGSTDVFLNDLRGGRIDSATTGSWYDVSQDGHGFIVEYLGDGRLLFYWFTFTPGGDREWIFGVLDIDGAVAEGQAFRQLGDGARFPPAIDPSAIDSVPWGTIRFEFTGCDSGSVSWEASPPYQDGGMELTRLTLIPGLECD